MHPPASAGDVFQPRSPSVASSIRRLIAAFNRQRDSLVGRKSAPSRPGTVTSHGPHVTGRRSSY
jgi:hypothetical protein